MSEQIVKSKAKEKSDDVDDDEVPEDDKPMTFWEHIEELRKRIVWAVLALLGGCVVAWYFKEKILAAIVKPFSDSWVAQHVSGAPSLHFASPGAALIAYVKLSLIGGFALAAPFIFYQLWSFIAPGLYAREKKYIIPFVFFSSVLFVGGGWFGYLGAFPFTFGYFLSLSGDVENVINITPTVMMEDYIDFVMQMLLGFGLTFQVPILLTFLALVGVVNHKMLIKFARYYVFIAFVVAAVLTPPDWTSQLIMVAPMIGLYFFSIGLVYIFQRRDSFDEEGKVIPKAEREKRKLEKEKAKLKTDKAAAEKEPVKAASPDAKVDPKKNVSGSDGEA